MYDRFRIQDIERLKMNSGNGERYELQHFTGRR